ncbi:glutathione S-transferase domain-containing protein [Mollisia scopiformis]|uniref:Glutathione S-transferase domain-containing protein n=1 Tax=Mollisia scopiformis TaxID=149040 RepID=A0A194WS77_MOLSC|nr:glutathione S-transferase domain-containing protein [Mollisia scopiformis]KUJ10826.1 glutathione S-transferase domain-containing protein [Mollisia scopiformis]
MTTQPNPPKRQKTPKDAPYHLIYWPGIPGRGEHIRLLLEEVGAPYTDSAHTKDGMKLVTTAISTANLGDAHNPPPLAPPILKHGDLTINQTSNILFYLGKRHGLMGADDDEDAPYKVNELVLTALDGLSNEPHDVHHPVSTSLYYEDQKVEAKRKANDYITNRLPKFLGYFERVLTGEASKGGEWLYGGRLTVADLVLWQCIDGVKFAFPNAMRRLEKGGGYRRVFGLYGRVRGRERIGKYLGDVKRQRYSMGVYRHYPELDEDGEGKGEHSIRSQVILRVIQCVLHTQTNNSFA